MNAKELISLEPGTKLCVIDQVAAEHGDMIGRIIILKSISETSLEAYGIQWDGMVADDFPLLLCISDSAETRVERHETNRIEELAKVVEVV